MKGKKAVVLKKIEDELVKEMKSIYFDDGDIEMDLLLSTRITIKLLEKLGMEELVEQFERIL